MPSELQKNLSHPERLVVAHPFHPVYILPLVEIVPGKQTSEENTIKAKQFMKVLEWTCYMYAMKLKVTLPTV